MRALAVLLLSSVAAIAAGGWYAYQPVAPTPGEQLLRYVPADSAFLVGFTRPLPAQRFLAAWSRLLPPDAAQLDPRRAAADKGSAMGVLTSLLQQHAASLAKGEWPFALYGFPPKGVMAVYMAGDAPVLRWQLADPRALWKTLDTAEQAAGVQGRSESRGKLRLRRYTFNTGAHRPPLELIFAAGGGFGLATLHTQGFDQKALDEALGLQMPANPFDPDELNNLAWSYSLLPGTAGFIDHQRLLAELSGAAGEHFDKIIEGIMAVQGKTGPFLPALHTPECHDDAKAIIDTWPRTVLGVTEFDERNGRLTERLIIETTDQAMLANLEPLRGHEPAVAKSPQSLFSFSLGIDFSSLTSVIGSFKTQFTGTPYRCPALIAAQHQLPWLSPIQLGIATALLADVKGIAAALFHLQPMNDSVLPVKGDGVVMIATDRPKALWRMVQFMGGLNLAQDPQLDGAPVALPRQLTRGRRIRVALRKEGLAVLIGNAQVPRNGEEKPGASTPNRLVAFRYHDGPATRAALATMEHLSVRMNPVARQRIRGALDDLQTMNMGLEVGIGLGDTGFNVDITVAPESHRPGGADPPMSTAAKSSAQSQADQH